MNGEKAQQQKIELKVNTDYLELLIQIADYVRIDSKSKNKNSDTRANTLVSKILSGEDLDISDFEKQKSKISQHFAKCQTQALENVNLTIAEYKKNKPALLGKEIEKLLSKLNSTELEGITTVFNKILTENKKIIKAIIDRSQVNSSVINDTVAFFKDQLESIDIHDNCPEKRNLAFRIDQDVYNKHFTKVRNPRNPSNRRALKLLISEKFSVKVKQIDNLILESVLSLLDDYEAFNKKRNEKRSTGSHLGILEYFTQVHSINKRLKEILKNIGGTDGRTNIK